MSYPLHRRFLLQVGAVLLAGGLLAGGPLAAPALAAPAQAASSLGQRAVTEAAKHKGQAYEYGAAGPTRFDCSGFTLYVFGRLGRSLPHSSSQQYADTRHLAAADKIPGDLVFMRNNSGGITHVGIYAGNNSWWVAPKTGDVVKLQKLYSTNYVVGRVG